MGKITKAHKLCFVIYVGGPLTRFEALRRVWEMDGKPIPFKRNSNNCYFVSPRGSCLHNREGLSSLRRKKLVKVVGKRGNCLLYVVTAKGRRMAAEICKL